MSRLIDADKLKDVKFQDSANLYKWGWNDAIDAIVNNAPAIDAEPMWIPCSERLPEYDGGMYLVTDYCEQINRKRIHISYCYVNREGFWSDIPIGYKVIAWMPLPKPYKEEDNETD